MNKRLLFALAVFTSLIGKAQISSVDLNFDGVWPSGFFGSASTPSLWVTTNVLTSPIISPTATPNPTTVTQSTNACNSGSSMQVETKRFPYNSSLISAYVPDTSGFAFTGSISFGTTIVIKDGFAYTQRPNKMIFCVATQPAVGDTSGIQLLLWKSVNGVRVYVGAAEERYTSTTAISSLSSKTLNISYFSAQTPDSACIYVASSFKFPTSGLFIRKGAKIGSTITVDNILLGINIGLNESYINAIELAVFPNPSNKAVVEFKTESEAAKKFVIQDIAGRPITEGYFENGKAVLNTNVYKTGIYIYSILSASNQNLRTGKLIIN